MSVRWVDPPPPLIKYEGEAADLRANPGRWARIFVSPSPAAAQSRTASIKLGRLAAFRPVGHWDARSSGCEVAVRYIPPKERVEQIVGNEIRRLSR